MDVAQLFNDHYSALFHYLTRLSGDRDVAADAAQETFVRLIERPPRGEFHRAWLYTVGTNLVFEGERTRGRRLRLMNAAPERAPMSDQPRDAHEAMESAERRHVVTEALAKLPAKERIALLMREEGFSHREIAVAIGTTVGSIGTLIARGLERLAGLVDLDRGEI